MNLTIRLLFLIAFLGIGLSAYAQNDPPFIGNQDFTIEENSDSATVVGTVTAFDNDGDDLSFTILSGNTNDAFLLHTDDGTLTVKTSSALDYESLTELDLEVEVDDGQEQDTAIVTISLTNLNDNSPIAVDQEISIFEGVGKVLLTYVEASDADGTLDTLYFSIIENDDPNGNMTSAIRLDTAGTAGAVIVLDEGDFDYETDTMIQIRIAVSDSTYSDTATVTINLKNANDIAPTLEASTFSLDENYTDMTSPFAELVWNDPDSLGTPMIFRLISGNTDGAFAIDSATGDLSVAFPPVLDYELNPVFELGISLTDTPHVVTSTITIQLNNLNDNEPIVNDLVLQVPEGYPSGLLIGTVTTSDADGDELTLSITDGNTDGVISIDTKGKLSITDSDLFDFEKHDELLLTIEANDGLSATTGTARIVLINANDNAPHVYDSLFEVAENGNDFLGTIRTFDADDIGLPAMRILDTDMADTFRVSPRGNVTTKFTDILDFERAISYSFQVEIDDDDFRDTALVQISILDINDAPTGITLSDNVVPQTSPPNTVVGTFAAIDEDAGDTHKYIFISDPDSTLTDNHKFYIDVDKLIVLEKFLYDEKSSYEVEIIAEDAEGEQALQRFTILVDEVAGINIWEQGKLGLYPNPVKDHLSVDISNPLLGELIWKISTISGQEVNTGAEQKHDKNLAFGIPVAELPLGSYMLSMELNGEVTHIRFVKK